MGIDIELAEAEAQCHASYGKDIMQPLCGSEQELHPAAGRHLQWPEDFPFALSGNSV
jgi:hypothetical protein